MQHHRRKFQKLLQRLIQVSCVLTALLLGCAIWACVVHTDFQNSQKTEVANLLEPTNTYFDANRNAKGIVHISELAPNLSCNATSDKEELSSLYTWPGNKKGYKSASGVYTVGEGLDTNTKYPAK